MELVLDVLREAVSMRSAPTAERCMRVLLGMRFMQPPPRYLFASAFVLEGQLSCTYTVSYKDGLLLPQKKEPLLVELVGILASEACLLFIERELLVQKRPDPISLSMPLDLARELPGFKEAVLQVQRLLKAPKGNIVLELSEIGESLAAPLRKGEETTSSNLSETACTLYLERTLR